MNLPNQQLIKTLCCSWLTFLIAGCLIQLFFASPKTTVLIDKSYCSAYQWKQVSQTYTNLYHQHQRRQIRLQSVILFSNLNQEIIQPLPSPKTIQNLSTYGQFDGERQAELQKAYPNAVLLSCHS